MDTNISVFFGGSNLVVLTEKSLHWRLFVVLLARFTRVVVEVSLHWVELARSSKSLSVSKRLL